MYFQDEASVAEILRRARGSLELVEIQDILPGLKSSTGMSAWHVCDEGMTQWFPDYQVLPSGHFLYPPLPPPSGLRPPEDLNHL